MYGSPSVPWSPQPFIEGSVPPPWVPGELSVAWPSENETAPTLPLYRIDGPASGKAYPHGRRLGIVLHGRAGIRVMPRKSFRQQSIFGSSQVAAASASGWHILAEAVGVSAGR